ncbi:MAG: cellulase family glycosylhydrolase [Ignavibacteriae bacterium]|nr:cellulase family glycosylhydrolase [Ignavibacteriota bacterium]
MLLLRFVFIVLLLSTLSCSERESNEFVQVQGTQLVRNGKPYYFVGTNMWYGAYLGSPGSTGDRPRLLRELDSLKSYGIINLRVLASSEESSIGRSVTPAFQPEPGIYDDSLLVGLDFLLAEMAKRDMQAVLYLTNYWEWSGGMAQYNVWTGAGTVNPEDTTQGWGMFMDFAASFYSNEASVKLYHDYVRLLVTRRNTVNNRLYAEDPTIMSWQLANEPRPGSTPDSVTKNLPAFYKWIDETAKLIHELDPNHLVSSGSEGTVGTFQSEEYYIEAYKTPHIDFLNFHLWAYNWGWFDPKRWKETLPSAEQNALAYINQQIGLARKLGKPTVMDEFGLGRDGGVIQPGTPTNARDMYYRTILQVIEDSARAGAPIAGTNFWAWGGEGKALNPDGMWKRGDPFVGDPPQEPQGQNSVFTSDTSTLRIIGEYAKRMMEMGSDSAQVGNNE